MRILGLDLGTTSVGWALVDWGAASSAGAIIGLGVRVFPEGVVREQMTSYPPNQIRRAKRLARRALRRRRVRRRLLGRLLHEMGLLPAFSAEKKSDWAAATRMDKKGDDKTDTNDPYALRKRALTERLEPWQLGRALYHLGKRRGFLGRDFDEADENDTETKGLKAEIEGLQAQLQGKTLGTYLAELPSGERKRKRHTGRDMFRNELARIWEEQLKHYPDVLTAERRQAVERIMFHQRPTFWRLNTLGHCRFCPGERPAPRAAWSTQQWVMLEQINKLRITGGNRRWLDDRERAIILAIAQTQRTVTFGAIRKALKSLWVSEGQDIHQTFNLEASEKDIKGNALEAALVEIFGDDWTTLPTRDLIRAEIHDRVFNADYVTVGKRRIEIRRGREQAELRSKAAVAMQRDWGLTAEQGRALSELRLPAGWSRLSTKAIETMLPEMEKGVGVGDLTMSPDWQDWRLEHFPGMDGPTGEVRDALPAHPKLMPETRNPTVTRTLNEVRKVVNNLIRTYGKPELIRVELARELRQPKKRREAIDKRNRERERLRKTAAVDLEKNGIPTTNRNVEKWLLWQESKERCPYTGKKIGFDALFRNGLFDIEHIWPRYRSLDNGFANKTLCEVEFNRNIKGNKTPYEVFGHDEEKFHQLKSRLKSCFDDPHHPKIKRFLAASFAEAGTPEFEERQLRDTAYAAVLARDFLKKLYPDDGRVPPVMTCNGSITAQLRDAWGLNSLLSDDNRKNRADHRHHAVDALAVAFTTSAFVKRLSDWNADWRKGVRPELPKPWASLKSDAAQLLQKIVVSHRVRKKTSGPIHDDMPLGLTDAVDVRTGSPLFVKRKAVADLSDGEVENIVDGAIRKLVKEKAPTASERKKLRESPLLMNGKKGTAVPINKVRVHYPYQMIAVMPLRPKPQTYATLGQSLRHLAIYRRPDKTLVTSTETRLQAQRNLRDKAVPAPKKREDGAVLVCTLCPGDVVERTKPDSGREYLVVRKVNQAGRIFYKPHNKADDPKPEVSLGALDFAERGCRKVSVDPIGRVRRAND